MTLYIQRSEDAGISWSSQISIGTGTRPSVAQLGDGSLYCSFEASGTCSLKKSMNFGSSWSSVYGSITGARPFMWTDPKYIRLFRVYQDGSYIKIQESTNGGITWSAAVNVVAEATTVYPEGSCLADGRPQIIYRKSGTWYLYRSNRIDGGGTWIAI